MIIYFKIVCRKDLVLKLASNMLANAAVSLNFGHDVVFFLKRTKTCSDEQVFVDECLG